MGVVVAVTYPASVVRRALGLLDEGTSSTEVAAELGVSDSTVRKWNRRRLAGWEPQDEPCRGATHGASLHAYTRGCRCPEARAAKREWKRGYDKALALRQPRLVPAVGTMRRLEGLMLLGWTRRDIAQAGGVSLGTLRSLGRPGQRMVTPDTEQAIKSATRVLIARGQGPSERLRNRARRWGYAPLMAWDDDRIDDPGARPVTATTTDHYARLLPDDKAQLAAEVNRSGVAVVAERYRSTPGAVNKALARGGYRAVTPNNQSNGEHPIYRKDAA